MTSIKYDTTDSDDASEPARPERPTLDVVPAGSGSFRITGNWFLPNTSVEVKVESDVSQLASIFKISDHAGKVHFTTDDLCQGVHHLEFTATDGRHDPDDPQQQIWSNTALATCKLPIDPDGPRPI